MKYIDLTNSDKNVIVDDEDYDYLKNFSDWYLNPIGYVTATIGNGKWKMHLLIAERFLVWDNWLMEEVNYYGNIRPNVIGGHL